MKNLVRICSVCSKEFTPRWYRISYKAGHSIERYSGQKYCKRKCYDKANYQKHREYFLGYSATKVDRSWKKSKKCRVCRSLFLPQKRIQTDCSRNCTKKYWKIVHRNQYLRGAKLYNAKRKLDPIKREKDRLAHKRWISNNLDKKRYYKYKRRASENIGNGVTEKEWLELQQKYKNRCISCQKEEKLTQDHILPLTLNGKHEINNLQPLCAKCNLVKSQKIVCYRCMADLLSV